MFFGFLSADRNYICFGTRLRNRQSVFFQPIQVKLNRLLDQRADFRSGLPCSYHSRQAGHVCGPSGLRFFVNHNIVHEFVHGFNLACLRTLFRVPGGRLSFGCPGKVTRPAFVGCCIAGDYHAFA
jgi:hypothetical protein